MRAIRKLTTPQPRCLVMSRPISAGVKTVKSGLALAWQPGFQAISAVLILHIVRSTAYRYNTVCRRPGYLCVRLLPHPGQQTRGEFSVPLWLICEIGSQKGSACGWMGACNVIDILSAISRVLGGSHTAPFGIQWDEEEK